MYTCQRITIGADPCVTVVRFVDLIIIEISELLIGHAVHRELEECQQINRYIRQQYNVPMSVSAV